MVNFFEIRNVFSPRLKRHSPTLGFQIARHFVGHQFPTPLNLRIKKTPIFFGKPILSFIVSQYEPSVIHYPQGMMQVPHASSYEAKHAFLRWGCPKKQQDISFLNMEPFFGR